MFWRSDKAKQVRPSRTRRKSYSAVAPLFCPNPEENVCRWMQRCFPAVLLARADAIREWLAKPLEARIQRSKHPAETAKLEDSQTPVASSDESEVTHSNETSKTEDTGWSGRNRHPIAARTGNSFTNGPALRMRNRLRKLSTIAKYSVLTFLVLRVGGERRSVKIAPLSNATIARTEGGKDPTAASRVLPRDETIGTTSNAAGPPTTIQSLSVECQEAPFCIEISTSGNESRPRLSTLSGPDRVVMKFQNTVFSSRVPVKTAGRGLVRAVRTGWDASKPQDVTVVIDLRGKCDYDLHTASNKVVVILRKAIVHQARL